MEDVLANLLRRAGLSNPTYVRRLSGRGLDHEVHVVQLADGRQVVLRQWKRQREPEASRSWFLEMHALPVPRLLAEMRGASLYELAPGELLGDLIETGRCVDRTWQLVGQAYRRVHAVRFPAGLVGEVQPHQIVLRPVDPASQVHAWIDESEAGLRRRAPDALDHLPSLHQLVDLAASSLRTAPTALGHGDINMWNVIVSDDRAWLIDWDEPRIGDPAMEVALLDKHASLFNGRGVEEAFFEGYGQPPSEPNTSLHRVVQTIHWAASSDWDSFEQQNLPADLRARTRHWLSTLLAYVDQLTPHLERLRRLV